MEPVTQGVSKEQLEKNKQAFLAQPGISEKINAISKKLGISQEELLHAIGKETAGSFSSSQRNLGDGKAVGLIQFYPDKGKTSKTIAGQTYEISDLEKMTELEQLNIVESYLTENFKNKGGKPGELYVSIAYPSLIGASDDQEIPAGRLDSVAAQNPGWVNSEGKITKSSISAFGSKPEFSQPFDTQDKSDAYKQIDEIISGSFYADYQKDLLRKKVKKDLEGVSGVKDISSFIENYNLEEEVLGRDGISSMQVDDNKNKLQEIIDDPNVSLKQKQDAQKILDDYLVRDIESLTTSPGSKEEVELINEKNTANQKAEELISELEKTKPEETKQKVKTTQPEEIKLFKELDVQEPEEEEEEVDIELSRRKQKKALKEAGITNAAVFDEKSKLAQFLSDNKDKINNTLNASIGLLTAAAGAKSIMQAIEKDNVAKSHVDPLFTEALQKIRAASEQGMPYEQRQAAMKDINSAYTGAMKNVMAISGGQRGMALANIGAVDANRLNSLVDLAAKDSDIRQKNLALFAQTAGQYSQQKLTADMSFEKLKATLDMNRKNRLATVGSGLLEQAFQMKTDYTAAKTASNLISNAAGSDADRVNTANPVYLQGFEQELDDGF